MALLLFLVLLGFCAFAAGCCAHRAGRTLRQLAPHEIFSELVERHRMRLARLVFGFGIVAPLSLPLLREIDPYNLNFLTLIATLLVINFTVIGLAVAIGDFPTRRVLFQDRRALGPYLAYISRLMTAFFGFWFFLLFAPLLVHSIALGFKHPTPAWIAAGVLCAMLFLWSRQFPAVFSWLMSARALEDSGLLQRFEQVILRSRSQRPRILACGAGNGGFTNAVALPAMENPVIVMGRPLLDRLDREEAAAIFAHELAHLEDFNPHYLKKLRRLETLLILAGSFLQPAVMAVAPSHLPVAFLVWFLSVLVILIWHVKDMQHRETGSDVRAVDLCGNPGALISGLTQVHVANHLPRRLPAEVERHSSHPSLARRIQDIQRYVGRLEKERLHAEAERLMRGNATPSASIHRSGTIIAAAAPLQEESGWHCVLHSRRRPFDFLILDSRRATWLTLPAGKVSILPAESGAWIPQHMEALHRDAISERSIAYGGLTELRLLMRADGGVVRAAEHSDGRRAAVEQFPARNEDLVMIREILDRVDTRLAPLAALHINHHALLRLGCFAVAIFALLAMGQGVLSVGSALWLVLLCVPAVSTAHRSWVAAAAGMAVLTVLTLFLSPGDKSWWPAQAWLFLALSGTAGTYVLRCAFPGGQQSRSSGALRDGNPVAVAVTLASIATVLALPQLWGLHGENIAATLYSFGLDSKATLVPFAAAGAALWIDPRFWCRVIAVLLGGLGTSHLLLRSQFFVENFM